MKSAERAEALGANITGLPIAGAAAALGGPRLGAGQGDSL